MSNIQNRVFEIESIQEEQNEIDSINNSSRRFQGHGPLFTHQDNNSYQTGFNNYDQQRIQVQENINKLYDQQKNLNYLQNPQLTPVQIYMKEKLLGYQTQLNNVHSGSLIIHNDDNSSQITSTIDKNLEQYYQQLQTHSQMVSEGYEYQSPSGIIPQKLFPNPQAAQFNQNIPVIQQQSYLQQQQYQQQQQQQFGQLQQQQQQQKQKQELNYQNGQNGNQVQRNGDKTQLIQNNQQNQQQVLQNQQINNINYNDEQLHQSVSQLNNISNQNITNSLRQSNSSSISQVQKNYFLVNPAFDQVRKIQDKLLNKNTKQPNSQKNKKQQKSKENSPERNNIQYNTQYDEQKNNNDNQNDYQTNPVNIPQSPKHIYLNLDALNQAQRKNSSTNSAQKKGINQNGLSNQQSRKQSSSSKNMVTPQSESLKQTNPPTPPPSIITNNQGNTLSHQEGRQSNTNHDEIYENYNSNNNCQFTQEQIKLLNNSDEKKKVVNSLMDSKKTYIDVRNAKQKDLIKNLMQKNFQPSQLSISQQQPQLNQNNILRNQTNIQNNQNIIQKSQNDNNNIYGLQSQEYMIQSQQNQVDRNQMMRKSQNSNSKMNNSQNQYSNTKLNGQTLSISRSLPQFISQESLANSAKERQNFDFVEKEDKTIQIKSKDNSFIANSSHYQSKFGSTHTLSAAKNHYQSTTSQFGQSNYFGITTSPKTKLAEGDFYRRETILDRNDFWVQHTGAHKQLLNLHYANEEMKECTFTPAFCTNNTNKKCQIKTQNLTSRVQQSLNPTFHKQAASMKSSYSRLHNFKKEMGFINELVQNDQLSSQGKNNKINSNLLNNK